uniref:Reverse transcriptase domain-containing protein n=1 Tax=Tanacetum cinerariifolium TaxID=118510 RepID=A0A699HG91_TANCI|nr:hypothetical protein [Tanacetum cinerariifolium]
MSTRSSARNLFPPLDNPELTIRRRYRVDHILLNDFEIATEGNSDPSVLDLQTMEELCQPTLNGRGGPIAPIAIQATNFGLKNDNDSTSSKLLPILWTSGKYFPPSMVTKLRNKITNFCQRPDESLFKAWECYKLSIDSCPNHNMLPVTQIDTFYNGLTLRHRDTINASAGGTFMKRRLEVCYDLIENMTTHHNDWDTLVQRTTVGQTQNVYAARANQGGNSYQPQGNRNLLSYRSDNYLGPPGFNQNQNQNNKNQNFQNQNRNQGNNHGIPQGNNQGRNQFFQGASHGSNPPPAYQAPAYQSPGYQALVHQPSISQSQVMTTTEFTNYMKANDSILKNMQTNMTSLTNSNLELKNMFGQFMKMNTASSSGSGTLPSNTVTNPKKDLKGIITQSGNAYQGPTIPTTFSSLPKVVERESEVTKDTVPPTNNRSTKDVQPLVVQIETLVLNSELVFAPVIEPVVASFGLTIKSLLTNKDKLYELARTPLNEDCSAVLLKKLPEKLGDLGKFLIPCDFPRMDEYLALADLGASINLMPLSVWNKLSLPELTPTLMTLELADRSISRPIMTFNLDQTSRYSANYNDMTTNQINVIDMAYEEYSREVLSFSDMIASGSPTPYYDLIVSTSSPTLTPFGVFLALEDDLISWEVNHSYYDTKGDILLLEAFLNDDPSLPPPTQGMYLP